MWIVISSILFVLLTWQTIAAVQLYRKYCLYYGKTLQQEKELIQKNFALTRAKTRIGAMEKYILREDINV